MCEAIIESIRKYIREEHKKDQLINISILSKYCSQREGMIFKALAKLEDYGEVKIVTRYYCPESHTVPREFIPRCPTCNLKYREDSFRVLVYVKPINIINVNNH